MKLSLLLTTLFSLLTFNVTALAKEKPTESKAKTIDTAKWYVGAELFNGYGISVGQQTAKWYVGAELFNGYGISVGQQWVYSTLYL